MADTKKPARKKAPSPRKVVEAFLGAAGTDDLEAALALIAEDCVYENVPWHRAAGKARIRKDLERMMRFADSFSIENRHIAASGDAVLTERVDTIAGRGFRIELPVMGTFVVRDGQIVEWRDYFDWFLLLRGTVGQMLWPFGWRR